MRKQGKSLPAIWDLVVTDMQKRDAQGTSSYGKRLFANDGRDTLRDAYEEALDLAVYLKKAILERDMKTSPTPGIPQDKTVGVGSHAATGAEGGR